MPDRTDTDKQWHESIPDWIKLGVTTFMIMATAIWWTASTQVNLDKRLEAVEAAQRAAEPQNEQISNQLQFIQNHLVRIETYLHDQNHSNGNDFPMPSISGLPNN